MVRPGDERFHPDNLIIDARNANILAIISKETGDIVWRVGPDFNENEATKKLGWIIGQHHLHMIPKGLPEKEICWYLTMVEKADTVLQTLEH